MMAHIDHGFWVRYKPEKHPEDAPTNAMFAKRESDNQDWYDYVHPKDKFNPSNVVIAAIWRDYANGYVVGPAVYDASLIFPADHIIYEIDDYAGSDPQEDLLNKIYDPKTGVFSDQPPLESPKNPMMDMIDQILKRLDRLEKKS